MLPPVPAPNADCDCGFGCDEKDGNDADWLLPNSDDEDCWPNSDCD